MGGSGLTTAACGTVFTIAIVVWVVILFLHKRHLNGDGGEDAVNVRTQPVHQKRVNVSENPKGTIKNDDRKIRHGK
jgi:hypothetical protein